MTKKQIGFNPKIHSEKFSSFWCLNSAWGIFEMKGDSIYLTIKYGQIELNAFLSDMFKIKRIKSVSIGNELTHFKQQDERIFFEKPVRLSLNQNLRIVAEETA